LYYYKAIAVRNGIESQESFRGYRTPPDTVSDITVTDITNSSFILHWTLPDPEKTSYEAIEIFEAETKIATLSKNSLQFNVTNYGPSILAVLHIFTVTGTPYKVYSAPKIISVRTLPARVQDAVVEQVRYTIFAGNL
jgi:hypothetical protein